MSLVQHFWYYIYCIVIQQIVNVFEYENDLAILD